jgi:outer membrane protein assembly factor BamE
MRNYLLIAAIGLATSGCGIIYKQPIYQGNLLDKDNVDQLAVGQSKQQVLALLGTPSVADPFHADRWDYTATERTDRLGRVHMKNFTVFFNGEQVTKWEGEYFPNQDEQLARNSVRQFGPNLAKDKKKGQGGG